MKWQYPFCTTLLYPLLMLALVTFISGCVYIKPASTPIISEYYKYSETNSVLVILLPGMGDLPSSFVKYGFVAHIKACQPQANILGVYSHFAYFRESTLVERLHDDIINPAQDAGIQKIWLMGVSMGGLGSLVYRQQHPDDLEAIIVMAPYIGEWDELSVYLADKGKARESISPDYVEIWDGLTSLPADDLAITLVFGINDDNNKQHQWLASLLDEEKIVSGPGGHRWSVWQKLLPKALTQSGLCNPS